MSLLDKYAKPSVAEEHAATSGAKKKKKLLGGRGGYNYPTNRIADVILDVSEPTAREKVSLISRLERYAEAFPDRNVDPCAAFSLEGAELRAHVAAVERRLQPDRNVMPGVEQYHFVVRMLCPMIEAFVPRLKGLTATYSEIINSEAATIKLLEAKYGMPSMGPELVLLGAFAIPTAALFHFNGYSEEEKTAIAMRSVVPRQ